MGEYARAVRKSFAILTSFSFQDLKQFWGSEHAELSNCLRYYGLSLFPSLVFGIVFYVDFFLNKSLSKKNQFRDYFRNYFFRLLFTLVLIGSCFYDLYNFYETFVHNSLAEKNQNLMQLVLASLLLQLIVYVSWRSSLTA